MRFSLNMLNSVDFSFIIREKGQFIVKKMAYLLLVTAILITSSACGLIEQKTTSTTLTNSLVYIPGSIKLNPDTEYGSDMAKFPITHRHVYYEIDGPYIRLVDEKAYDAWNPPSTPDGIEPTEMLLVSFIKQFNISKEDFIEATNQLREIRERNNWDTSNESNEIPNPDVIYTFDNDLISEYYRRE